MWSSWIVICLSWRSGIVTRNLIVNMFLSVLMTMFLSNVFNLDEVRFSNKIYGVHDVCFLNRPFYTRRINPTCSIENDFKCFSLIKFWKCQYLNSLFREIYFLELPKYSWNLQMLNIIQKFKNWKILLKNKFKNWYSFWWVKLKN